MKSNGRSIMIFGAGINQLELIKSARQLEFISVVVDPAASPPGRDFADFYYQVDGQDYETTRSLAVKHNVQGIVTGQMEKPLRLMARLAKDLNLIFHTPEVLENSLDKWLMKKKLMAKDIPCARGKLFTGNQAITGNSLSGFNFPLIIKPRDAFSSRGVYKVDCFSDILKNIEESRSFASHSDIIIEEFMEGREYSIETITYHGDTTIIQFTEKFITPYPNTVELAHLQPASLTDFEKDEISKIVIMAINALGIDNSAAHAEVFLTSAGPKIIEVGARLGGDFISSHLTFASTGISMDKAAVNLALGNKPDLVRKWSKYSYIEYLVLPSGKRVHSIHPLDDMKRLPGFIFGHIFLDPGDTIYPIIHSALRPACVIVTGETKEEVLNRGQQYLEVLKNKLELS